MRQYPAGAFFAVAWLHQVAKFAFYFGIRLGIRAWPRGNSTSAHQLSAIGQRHGKPIGDGLRIVLV